MRRLAGRIMLLDGWRRALLAVAAGAVFTLALAPVNIPLAGFVSVPLLVWLLDGAAGHPGHGFVRRLAPAFGVGWCFGFGYFVGGLWWLGAAMLVDAQAFLWALPLAVLGLPAVLAVYHGLAAAVARAFWSSGAGRLFALAGSFALFEYLRGFLFTGFPWNEIGIMAAPIPLMMQSASLVGIHGLTLLVLLVFGAPALLVGSRAMRAATLALSLILVSAHLGYGVVRMSAPDPTPAEALSLRIVQPNILQSQKWDAAEAERIFATLLGLTARRAEGADGEVLVVWPESSFPFILTDRPDAAARLSETLLPGETLLAGATRREEGGGDGSDRFYNSVLAIDEEGVIQAARDKVHLVPFGEYLPFQATLERFGLTQLATLPGGFSAAASRSPVTLEQGISFLALICYEIVFQDEIDLSGSVEPRPDFILNVTNDAWYGTTPGPYQHFRHAQLTAVAFGLPLVRAANSGISAVMDARGRPVAVLGLDEAGVVSARLPGALPATPYARFGNIPFALLLAASGAIAGFGAFRGGTEAPQRRRRGRALG